MVNRLNTLPDGTYIVAVGSLYATLTPSLVMAIAFVGVSSHVALEAPDVLLTVVIAIGIVAVVVRLGALLRHRARALSGALDLPGARYLDRLFGIPYLAFAAVFGAFSVRALQVGSAESHMLVIGLLFGYGAGVASGIYLRPWIGIPSLAMAFAPTGLSGLMAPDSNFVATGALLLLFLFAGIQAMLRNYRITTAEITARRTFAMLARSDALTGLENRLSLREAFDRAIVRAGRDGILAVHCLDLDRFKAVNDTYGHPVGDALLRAVSVRLRTVLRQGDVAARVGGDEFVVLQVGAQQSGEVDLQARRTARAIAEPYSILGHQLSVGTSVGYALYPEHGRDLEELISRADEALIRVKRDGGGVALYQSDAPHEPRQLSA